MNVFERPSDTLAIFAEQVTTVAREVGVECEVADEVMARLRRLRLVTVEEGVVIVADVARLQDFVEFLEMPQKFGGEA